MLHRRGATVGFAAFCTGIGGHWPQDAPPTDRPLRTAPISCRVATKGLAARGRPLPARHDPAAARGRPLPARHDPPAPPDSTRSPPYPAPAKYSPCAGAVRPAAERGRPREQLDERRHRPPAAAHLQHRPDQRPDHLAHERVRLYPKLQEIAGAHPVAGVHTLASVHTLAGAHTGAQTPAGPHTHTGAHSATPPVRRVHLAREPDVLGLRGRERREVVDAHQRRRAGLQRVHVQPVRPPQRPPSFEHAPRAPHEYPVAVRPARGVPPRVEPVIGRDTRQRRDIRGQQRVQRPHRNWWSRIGSHLTPRMHPRVGATRHRQAHALAAAKSHRERARPPLELSAAPAAPPSPQTPPRRTPERAARPTAARPVPAAPSRSNPTAAAPASESANTRPAAPRTAARSPRTACRP